MQNLDRYIEDVGFARCDEQEASHTLLSWPGVGSRSAAVSRLTSAAKSPSGRIHSSHRWWNLLRSNAHRGVQYETTEDLLAQPRAAQEWYEFQGGFVLHRDCPELSKIIDSARERGAEVIHLKPKMD